MSITITVDSTTPTAELDAIAVLIAALGGRAGRTITAMYEELVGADAPTPQGTEVAMRPTLAPSPVSGEASAPSTSATVPPSPVAQDAPVVLESVTWGTEVIVPAPFTPPVPPAPVAVVPPPPVTSGAAPVSPTPSQGAHNASGVQIDGDGLPWDARIHSGNREMTAKGVWRRRKNTADETWDAVRAELKQVMSAPTPLEAHIAADAAQYADEPTPLEAHVAQSATVTSIMVPAPPTEAALAFAAIPSVPVVVPVPPTPPAAVPVPPAPVATEEAPVPPPVAIDAINGFLMRLTQAQMDGTVLIENVQAAAHAAGLTSIRDVRNRPDLIPGIEKALGMGAPV